PNPGGGSGLACVVFTRVLVSRDGFSSVALPNLRLAELEQSVTVVLVQIGSFLQRCLGAVRVLFGVAQRSAEQIVKCAAIGDLGDLRVGRGNALVYLVLGKICVHEAA